MAEDSGGSVRISLKDVYDQVTLMASKVDTFVAEQSAFNTSSQQQGADHETRIRRLEFFAFGVIAAGLGLGAKLAGF